MQRSHLRSKRCKPSQWNVFVKMETKWHNSALPSDAKWSKSCDLMPEIWARWQAMSTEEWTEATKDLMVALENLHEVKELAMHNVMTNAFVDSQKTLEKIDRELSALHSRAGVEFNLLAVHGDTEHWNQPHIFHTGRAAEFFDCCYKVSIRQLAFGLEGYCISGVQGLAKSHMGEVLELKRNCSTLILEKLKAATASTQVNRMYYTNFDISITEKYHIILESWPLEQFCSPGDISSCNELRILYHALNSNTTHFCRLSDEEFNAWDTQRFKQRLAESSSTASVSAPGTVSKTEQPPSVPMSAPTAQDNSAGVSQAMSSPVIVAPSTGDNTTTRGIKCAIPIDIIFSLSGEGIPVQKRPWKEHSDKRKKCGPRKNKDINAQATILASPTAAAPLPSPAVSSPCSPVAAAPPSSSGPVVSPPCTLTSPTAAAPLPGPAMSPPYSSTP